MSKFPFISNFEGTEYEKETKNRIEKVRAFYENRELYDITIKKHPEQRLASDIDKDGYKIAYKRLTSGSVTKIKNEQVNIFK